jgi:hypothetical protein
LFVPAVRFLFIKLAPGCLPSSAVWLRKLFLPSFYIRPIQAEMVQYLQIKLQPSSLN